MFDIYRDFEDGAVLTGHGYDIFITRRSVGRLDLPSGQLVACDPFDFLDTEAFSIRVPPGTYPVRLVGAQLRDAVQIAYAVVELKKEPAVRWVEAELPGDAHRRWDEPIEEGFVVNSSVACFIDHAIASRYLDYREILPPGEPDEIVQRIHSKIRRNVRGHGIGWARAGAEQLGGNLIAFEVEPGAYTTYVGYTPDDEVARIVADFGVLDLRFPSFSMF